MTTRLHRGKDCGNLKSLYDQEEPFCQKAIERYETPAYSFLNTVMWVSVGAAAEVLKLPAPEVLRQGKSGELPFRYRKGALKWVMIYGRNGREEMTICEAAKAMGHPQEELERQIDAGEVHAYYIDKDAEIQVTTRWDYEKCPLWATAGVCGDYMNREGQ